MVYCAHERDALIAERLKRKVSGLTLEEEVEQGNLTKELGRRWKALNPNDKAGNRIN